MKNRFVILLSIATVLSLLALSVQTQDRQPTKIILNLYTSPTPYNASSLSQMESLPSYPYTEIVTASDLQTIAKINIQEQKDNILQIPEGKYFVRIWWSERRMSEYVNDKTGYSLDSSNSSVTIEYYTSGVVCLADTPKRIEPNYQIPLMAQMHNPATTTLYYIWVYDNYTGQLKDTKNVSISTNWHTIYYYNRNTFSLSNSWASIMVILAQWDYVNYYWVYEYSYMNVYVSNYSLPKLTYWYAGDQHVHSEYTDDIYEFGIPIDAITTGGRYFGLNYTIVTDHGYDVYDDWTTLGSKVGNYSGFWLIRGEEVSCDSNPWSADDAGHLLASGTNNFIDTGHGSYYAFNPTKDENTVLYELKSYNGFGYIAHPFDSSWPHSWPWRFDLMDEIYWENPVKGLEIINGIRDADDDETKNYWINNMLLQGKKIFAMANSDAHELNMLGNYGNWENFRTYIYTTSLTKDNILSALRNGNSVITSGPLLTFTANGTKIGSSISVSQNGNVTLNIQGAVTPEFSNDGFIYAKLYYGTIGGGENELYLGNFYANPSGSTTASINVSYWGNNSGYIRLEGYSYKDGNYYYAFTNPVWVNVVAQTSVFPHVHDDGNIITEIFLSNTNIAPANVTLTFYDNSGTIMGVSSYSIPAYGRISFFPRNVLGSNFIGSVRIESDQRLAGTMTISKADESWAGIMGMIDVDSAPTNAIYAHVHHDAANYVTFIGIRNLGTNTTNLKIKFYNNDGSLLYTHYNSVGVNAKYTFYPRNILGYDFIGSIEVNSTQKIASYVGLRNNSYTWYTMMQTTNKDTAPTTIVYPHVHDDGINIVCFIGIRNVGTSTTNAFIKFYDNNGILLYTKSQLISANAKFSFYPRLLLGNNFIGSIEINSSQPIAGYLGHRDVNHTWYGIMPGTEKISAPTHVFFSNVQDNNTSQVTFIGIMNVGTTTASLTINFYDIAGNLANMNTEYINQNAKLTFFPKTITGYDFDGSVEIISTQPIAVYAGRRNVTWTWYDIMGATVV